MKHVNIEFKKSFVDLGLLNGVHSARSPIDSFISFFLFDTRKLEEFEPFTNDFTKLAYSNSIVSDYTRRSDQKFITSYEEVLVFEL